MISLLLSLLAFSPSPSHAQYRDRAEFNYTFSSLSNATSSWNDFSFREFHEQNAVSRWLFEGTVMNRYGETGLVLGVTYTRDYSPTWYQIFSATVATNPTIYSTTLFFTELNHKFGPGERFIIGLGGGRAGYASGNYDWFGVGDFTFYALPNLPLQAGVRLNQSYPGSIQSFREYFAVTWVAIPSLEFVYRFDNGMEGYTLIAANNFRNRFHSTSNSFVIRTIQGRYAIQAGIDFYRSEIYNRTSYTVGGSYSF